MPLLSENKGTRKMYKLPHTGKKLELLLLAAILCTAGKMDWFFLHSRMCDIVQDLMIKILCKVTLTKRMQNRDRDLEIHIVFFAYVTHQIPVNS